jgi:tRNA (mo5U34)-methyltransferase
MNRQPPQTTDNSAPAMEDPPPHIAPAAPQPDVAELLAAGLEHHKGGRLAEAEAHYRRILDAVPDRADVLHLLGGLVFQTGRHGAAIELIDRAIECNGNDPSYHCSRGLVLQSLNRLDEAVASYDRALALDPTLTLARNSRAKALRDLRLKVQLRDLLRARMFSDDLVQLLSDYQWYHKINLGNGLITPGRDYDDNWELVRSVRKDLDYRNKRVLDIASWDGMWSFEAEQLGAEFVVATDWQYGPLEPFLACKRILNSKVVPCYNCSIYNLRERLDPIIYPGSSHGIEAQLFDIVQNLGLLYHLRDPLYALSVTRSLLKTGGKALIETAAVLEDDRSYMIINGYPGKPRIYDDESTWWAMTLPCLREALTASLLRAVESTIQVLPGSENEGRMIGRVALVAEALHPEDSGLPSLLLDHLMMPSMSPGIALDHLRKG